jgi:hypothetical protein
VLCFEWMLPICTASELCSSTRANYASGVALKYDEVCVCLELVGESASLALQPNALLLTSLF